MTLNPISTHEWKPIMLWNFHYAVMTSCTHEVQEKIRYNTLLNFDDRQKPKKYIFCGCKIASQCHETR